MATDRQTDTPDPLRNLKVGDVVTITSHDSFEKPEGIEDEAWAAAIEEVRAAVRTVRLDVPIEKTVNNFLPGVCREVDRRIKAYKGDGAVDKKRLHDPVIDVVREQIGLFLSVRIRLGRNEKFGELIRVLKRLKGDVSLNALEREHDLHAVVQTMRMIAKQAGNTAARKEAIWKYMKEFLAEQAGLEKVDFPGQKFSDERPEDDIEKKLRKLGIILPHGNEIERRTGRLDRLHGETLEDVREHIAAVDKFLLELRGALERATGAERLLSGRMNTSEQGPLREFKRRERELKIARETLLEAMNVTELVPKDERAHKERLRELEKEFAEPLRVYREQEASMEELAGRVEGMEGLDAELKEKLGKLRQLEAMLRKTKFGDAATGAAAAALDAGAAPGFAPLAPSTAPTPIATRHERLAAPASRHGRPSGGGAFLRSPDGARPERDARGNALRIAGPSLALDALRTTVDGRFSVDDVVTHTAFGRGTVVRVDGVKTVVTVQFERDGVGTKEIKYDMGNFLTKVE